jgi:hypothetical protein
MPYEQRPKTTRGMSFGAVASVACEEIRISSLKNGNSIRKQLDFSPKVEI